MSEQQLVAALRAALPAGYEVDDYLDRGGQGAVFVGAVGGEQAVLKVLHTTDNPARVEREIVLLREVDCPHLVSLLDSTHVEVGGVRYPLIAYRYCPGGDLRQMTGPDTPFANATTIATIGEHVGRAVEELWTRRIVHRDIKPANILRAGDGVFVLADVGLARHLNRSTLTAPGGVAGTDGYKSPEQARGRRNLTIHSDVFSLGITLYEVAAHSHPFSGDQGLIGQQMPTPLPNHRTDLDRRLVDLIHAMMAGKPGRRPTDFRARFGRLREGP